MKINGLQEAKQAAFNGTVRGLASQGWQQCLNKGGSCVLNQGKPGTHCALGWLIPWDSQKHLAHKSTGTESWALIASKKVVFAEPLQDFLKKSDTLTAEDFAHFLADLQYEHDHAQTSLDLKQRMKDFGSTHKLTWPKDFA